MVVRKAYLVPFLSACIILCLSIYLENRSFILGSVAALIFLLFTANKFRFSAISICLVTMGFTGLILVLALAVKSASTHGRILIYKVSAGIFREHYLWGLGLGNFKKQYLHYQAAYFERGNYSEQELLLAGNTYYAFNDHWQFMLEWGVFGGVVLLLAISSIVYMIHKVLSSADRTNTAFLTGCVLLMTIAVAACFNHVFERVYIQIVFLLSLSVIVWGFAKQWIKNRVFYFACVLLGVFMLLTAEFGHKIIAREAYHQWREANSLRRMGYFNQAFHNFEVAYPYLQADASFLRDYAEMMMSARRFHEAIEIFEQALPHWVGHRMYMSLGTCYHQVGRYDEAERTFLKSVYMVPNRFESRFALFTYYIETDRKEEASYWGKSIMELPVKVPSARVDMIRKDVQRLLMEIK